MLETGFPKSISLSSLDDPNGAGSTPGDVQAVKALAEASGAALGFFDRELRLVASNQKVRGGRGQSFSEILGLEGFGNFEDRLKACLRGEAQDFIEAGQGTEASLRCRLIPALGLHGDVAGLVGMWRTAEVWELQERNLAIREEALTAREAEFRRQSTTDALSGTLTRGAIILLLEEEIRRASRYGRPFALVLFDLDHFKLVNDIHGRAAGDETIRRFSSICRATFRTTDYLGRYGGEEFLGILPEVDGKGGLLAAERVRSALQAERFRIPRPLGAQNIEEEFTVTVSSGVVGFEKGYDSDTMLAAVDKALYKAKDKGRNRSELHGQH